MGFMSEFRVSVLMRGRAEAGITRPRELSPWDVTCILCLPRSRTHLAENTAEGFSGFLARSPKERLHFLYKRQGLPSLGDLKKSGELCQQAQTPGDMQQETRCPQGGCTSLKPQLGTTQEEENAAASETKWNCNFHSQNSNAPPFINNYS